MKNYIITDTETAAVKAYLETGEKSVTVRKIRSQSKTALPILVKDLVLLCKLAQEKSPTFSLKKLIQEAQI